AALPPTLTERADLREDVMLTQCAAGWAFPNALLQHAFASIERLSIDIGELQRRRDRLVPALREMGYETSFPEGTFYVVVRARERFAGDHAKLVDALADRDTFVLPGALVELPGWVRLSLTANDEMIEKGIEAFRRVHT